MTELAALSEEVGVSERTLRRAVGQGALRAARPTERTLHVPYTERRYIRRSWSTLAALRAALRTERNVRLAVLFGSAARGSDNAESDLDVLVALCDPSLERVVDLSLKLTELTGRRADVVRREDVESEPSFLLDVVTDGRVLVDRDGLWPELLARETQLRHRAHRRQKTRAQAALAGIDRLLNARA
ncbi:MAG: nucleotidyltransferase family protein [Solirubrobacteraceae bacterium]